MKHKRLFIIAAAAAVLGAAACTGLEESEGLQNFTMSLEISPESETVIAEGSSVSFSFNAPDYWFANCPADWVSVEPASGKPGDNTITVTAIQNTGAERTAVITVTAKTQKGQFEIIQEAWPYGESGWYIFGTVGSGVVGLSDMGDKLVWNVSRMAYDLGQTFKFRMGSGDANVYGLDGSISESGGVYSGNLKKGGDNITLPEYGYWDVTLDLNTWSFTATLVERYPWTIIGTIGESDWDNDFAMTDAGDQLVWKASKVETHDGELFKFRMNGAWTVNLGADGEFAAVAGSDNTWELSLKQDGDNIALPKEGFWDFTLDVAGKKLTAVLVEEFIPNPLPSNWEALWLNDGSKGEVSWGDLNYRFGLDGNDGNNECDATFSADVWDRIKNETIYAYVAGANPSIRVCDGWWTVNLTAADIQPGSNLLTFNNAKTWILTINLSDNPDLAGAIDAQHLLFTGTGYTLLGLYAEKKPASGDTVIWTTETVFDSWSATLVVPAENFASAKAGDIVRVYLKEKGDDYNPVFKHVDDWSDWPEFQNVKVDADGYFEAAIPASALDELKSKGLRFQGVGFTVTQVLLVPGPVVLWNTESVFDSWSATIVIPAENFETVMGDDIIRVYITAKGDDYNPVFKHVDDWSDWPELQNTKVDGEDYFEATVPDDAVDELKAKGLRFQGVGFTVTKVVLL